MAIMKAGVRCLVALSLAAGWLAAGGSARAAQKSQPTQGKQGGQAQPSQKGAQAQPPGEEQQAFQALSVELDPDRQIQEASEYEKKYPSSPMLSYVYYYVARAYQMKGDVDKILESGEKSLKLKSDNLASLILVSAMLPQPQALKGSDLDKGKQLSEAEQYANQALQLIDQLPKQPNETDEALQKRKNQVSSEPHSALGMVHLQRSTMTLTANDPEELAKAAEEYKKAVSLAEPPNGQDYYRLGEAEAKLDKLDEALDAFTRAEEFEPRLKPYADPVIEKLKKKQAETKQPAKP